MATGGGLDLAARLAARGRQSPKSTDFGRECGPPGPSALSSVEGSGAVRGQMQGFVASVLRGRTVAELREVCRLQDVPSVGLKEDIIRRLLDPDCVSGQEASPASKGSPKRRRVSRLPRDSPASELRPSLGSGSSPLFAKSAEQEATSTPPREAMPEVRRRRMSVKGPGFPIPQKSPVAQTC
ncbi:unnamed protein product [Polarella glacialis]|uniref:SAP domain-containing protein n=1 Tax=Polarella glacialis TaxID=89957 RepID=A0A813IWD8_POLGL|nr:unnamed protein product [Polarella glacialis]